MHRLLRPAACCLALAAAACGSNNTTAPTTPDVPETQIEQFTGTITTNGAHTHFFSTASAGSVLATLGDVTPDGVIVGMQMGTANGELCTAVQSIDTADEGTRILLAASAAGNLCVRIYDTGGVTQPTDYFIQVEHP